MAEELPLLAGQSSIWAAEQFGTEGYPYNLQWAQSYRRDVAGGRAAMQAVHEVINRHEALQGRIVSERGIPSQRFDCPPALESIECGDDDPSGMATLDRLLSSFATRAFDLERGPLSEFYVVSAKHHIHIAANQHHVMSDGMTRSIIATELDDLVHGRTALREPTDYVSAVHEALELEKQASAAVDKELDELVSAHLEPPQWAGDPESSGFDLVAQSLPAAGDALARAVERSAPGLAAFLIAASAVGLAPWLPDGPTVMALVASTRPRQASDVAGCFVNSIPVVLPTGLAVHPDGVAMAHDATRHAARLRHLPMARLTAAARRRDLDLGLGERLLVSVGELQIEGGLTMPWARGNRGRSTTIRLWRVNADAELSIESHRSMLTHTAASEALGRMSGALEQLRT